MSSQKTITVYNKGPFRTENRQELETYYVSVTPCLHLSFFMNLFLFNL